MEFRILGPFEVEDAEGPLLLPGGRARSLLALLVLHAGYVMSIDRLLDELWGATPPATARTKLHGLVSALRKALGRGRGDGVGSRLLLTRAPGYVMPNERVHTDAQRFRRLIAEAASAAAPRKVERLRAARDLWRGDPLVDFAYQPFAQEEIASLSELRVAALEEQIDAELALGGHRTWVGRLQRLVAEHPYRERLHGQYILALYRCHRRAEALEAYRQAEATLAEELGVEPGHELQQLRQAILRHEDLPPAPSSLAPSASLPAAQPTLSAQDPAKVHRSWLTRSRRPVTAVFAELGYRAVGGRDPDPEERQPFTARAFESASRLFNHHGGSVEGLIGGVVVAVFGVPVVHEDDASRAVRAAVALRRAVDAMNADRGAGVGTVTVRMGITTGEVVVGGARPSGAYGDTVDMAARLQQHATEGEILLGDATTRLIHGVAEVERAPDVDPGVRATPVVAWRLRDVRRYEASVPPGGEFPMIGRRSELAYLGRAFEAASRDQRTRLVTVLGEAGVGKSRLLRAFTSGLTGARVLTGHCPAYGEGITFWPLREIVLQAAGGRRDLAAVETLLAGRPRARTIAGQIGEAIGLAAGPSEASELFPATRTLLGHLAADRPLTLVLEDVHWAQATLLDLVDYLVATLRGPVLLVCAARPELAETRPGWPSADGGPGSIWLRPLDAGDSEALVVRQFEGRSVTPDTVTRIVETGQGNPLFLEQLATSLPGDANESEIPPTLQALLAARLDRLGPAVRDVLRGASVLGGHFSCKALAAIVPEELRPFLHRYLDVLRERELIRPSDVPSPERPSSPRNATTFEFRHVLIQRAAYRSVTHQARAELHEAHADWLEEEAQDQPFEVDEVAGFHLEQAHRYGSQLGLPEERLKSLAARAAHRLASAGRRAFARFDVAAAVNLLSRAEVLLEGDEPERAEVLQILAEAHQVAGRHGRADAVLGQLLEHVERHGDQPLAQRVPLERARIRLFTGPDPVRLHSIEGVADVALAAFAAANDDAGIALAADVLGQVHLRRGRLREMERVARRGLDNARRSGRTRAVVAAQFWVAHALVTGPTPADACIATCEALVHWREVEHPLVLAFLGQLRAMRLQREPAAKLIQRARQQVVERIRARRPLMFVHVLTAHAESLVGRSAAAEASLRAGLELAIDMGEAEVIAQTAGALSRVLPGDAPEAVRLADLSAERAPSESVDAQASWRSARARVLAQSGQLATAEELAHEAVDLVPVEMVDLRAGLQLGLASILTARGRRAAATDATQEALVSYERKGNLVGVQRAHAALGLGRP